MTLPEAIEIVERHQQWRRGAEIEMVEPKVLGEATDVILIAAKTYNKIVQITNVSYSITQ